MNRTGSTSLYEYLTEIGYHTTHDPNWWYWRNKEGIDQFDAYTDGFEGYRPWRTFPDLGYLNRHFPNATYIANTRPLDAWLASRLKHNSMGYKKWKLNKDTDSLLRGWIRNRNYWHQKITTFAKHNEGKVLWLNIQAPESSTLLNRFLKVDDSLQLPHSNAINNNPSAATTVKAFLELHIDNEDHRTTKIAKWKGTT